MRIAAAVQNFRQGWGGAPESIRLLGSVLREQGVEVDVFDQGRLHRSVGEMTELPRAQSPGEFPGTDAAAGYSAYLIAGPWQAPLHLRGLLARRGDAPLYYLPRGGLGRIEFSRPRDLKKWPYFFAIERRFVDAAQAVVFSSECERDHTVTPARARTREVVIPDLFSATPSASSLGRPADSVRFAFMAEIAPRKALLPLIEGFTLFAARCRAPVSLTIGGAARPGSETYLAKVRQAAAKAPANCRIEFIGSVANHRRDEFYASCDVFLVPSHFESFGLTVLEGLSAGCSLVVGPDLGVLEYLPERPHLTVARSVAAADIAEALEIQFNRARDAGQRATTAAAASRSIGQMNALAVERWMQLLGG